MKVIKMNLTDANDARKYRKENHFSKAFIVVDAKTKKKAIDCRIYDTKSRKYVCLWVITPEKHYFQGAFAGGYGYHMSSQALEKAIYKMGIELNERIGGVGEEAMEEALLAIAEHLGYEDPILVKAYG